MVSRSSDYTVTTAADPESALSAICTHAARKGFQVLDVHDLGKLSEGYGATEDPAYVAELCNMEPATDMLPCNALASFMMPCKIAVYQKDGETHISALRPNPVAQLFPQFAPHLEEIYRVMLSIVKEFAAT